MIPAAPPRQSFQTTAPQGLARESFPLRLFQKSKRFGVWNPSDIDLARDREDWLQLSSLEQDVLLRLTALFQAGEEAVTLDLLPLILAIAREGRLEEEMYLTSFLFEEAKHVEAFRRFFDEVAVDRSDLSRYHTASYRTIFYEELPSALGRLLSDPSPANQAVASVTYNMIVEGVLAETGYHAYGAILARHGLMPGMQQVVRHLQRDESRHLAYGVYLLSRLVAEHGEPVWQAIESRMGELLLPAIEIINEIFAAYETVPFGLVQEEFSQFALDQFQRRMARIELAKGQSLGELAGGSFEGAEASEGGAG
jgi:ribonucleoside-diphosphate reductase beta chain